MQGPRLPQLRCGDEHTDLLPATGDPQGRLSILPASGSVPNSMRCDFCPPVAHSWLITTEQSQHSESGCYGRGVTQLCKEEAGPGTGLSRCPGGSQECRGGSRHSRQWDPREKMSVGVRMGQINLHKAGRAQGVTGVTNRARALSDTWNSC